MQRIYNAYPIQEQIRLTSMYSLFTHNYAAGYQFSGESHAFWECVHVLRGEICVCADDRVYNMSAGEIVFHKPMELHKFSVTDPAGAELLIFSFSAEGKLTVALQDKVFSLTPEQKDILSAMLAYAKKHAAGDSWDFGSMLRPLEYQPHYGQMVALFMQQLFLSLTEEGMISPASLSPDAVLFQKAINYLASNVHTQPTLADTARYCNMSQASLKRLFDKYAGIGVHKYLLKLKMRMADQMLKSQMSVTEVAERLGFSSQGYFSKAYKRETGKNPSDAHNH